jgi:hypothetical protein
MSSIQLFECTPLNASITPAQCTANKKRGVFACDKCAGLGMPVQLQPIREVKDMGRPAIIRDIKKGDRFDCPGCGRTRVVYESKGRCAQCNTRERLRRLDTEQPAGTEDTAWQPEQLSDPAPVDALPVDFGKIENVTGEKVPFGVDPLVLANIQRTLAELEQRIIVDLSGVGFFEAMDYLQNIRHGMAREVTA